MVDVKLKLRFNVLQSLVFVFHVTCSLDISEVFLLKIHSGAKRVPRLLYENHSPLPSLPPYSSFCLQAIVSLHWHHPLPKVQGIFVFVCLFTLYSHGLHHTLHLSSNCICISVFVQIIFRRIAIPAPQVQIRRSLMSMAVSSVLWRAFCPDMSPQ